jgi:hypothetical protein
MWFSVLSRWVGSRELHPVVAGVRSVIRLAFCACSENCTHMESGPTRALVPGSSVHQMVRDSDGGSPPRMISSLSPTTQSSHIIWKVPGSSPTKIPVLGVGTRSLGCAGCVSPSTRPSGSCPPIAAVARVSQRLLRASDGFSDQRVSTATLHSARGCLDGADARLPVFS